MGSYFNPPGELPAVGRNLNAGDFRFLTSQLHQDEVLIGLYDRMIFKNAPHLYSTEEMEEFESQVRRGILINYGYYAVKIGDPHLPSNLRDQEQATQPPPDGDGEGVTG